MLTSHILSIIFIILTFTVPWDNDLMAWTSSQFLDSLQRYTITGAINLIIITSFVHMWWVHQCYICYTIEVSEQYAYLTSFAKKKYNKYNRYVRSESIYATLYLSYCIGVRLKTTEACMIYFPCVLELLHSLISKEQAEQPARRKINGFSSSYLI